LTVIGTELDHIAIAVERWADAWPRFVVELGGRWASGGRGPGFAPSQYEFANGMRLEVLEPNDVDANDFLRRFIDRSGVGPHHLTFKVPDLRTTLADLDAAGYRPVGVDFTDPEWLEAFIHPKDGPGVVVQVAQAANTWENHPPHDIPPAGQPPASLVHIAHAVASIDDALRLFGDVLGAIELDKGDDADTRWLELGWTGPGRVRLLEPASPSSAIAAWLGDRPGRVHHLAFRVAGVTERSVIDPDPATGTRVVLLPA